MATAAGWTVADYLIERQTVPSNSMNEGIVLELLDAAQHRPLQTWSFPGLGPIAIGRASDNDVVLADPFVSRAHARLESVAGNWRLISLSQQQVLWEGQRHSELPLSDGVVFQLGPRGCVMRFSRLREPSAPGNYSTLTFDTATMPVFMLDSQQLEREVAEITSGDYFRDLQKAAQRLRQRREQEDPRP